jgi:hypothetical protein
MAVEFSESLGFAGFWQLEAAAMLSQLGYLSLPVELVEKLYYGKRLTQEEQTLAEGVPQVARQLLGQIPRLEPVLHILETVGARSRTARSWPEGNIGVGAQILAIVLEYDSLIAQGQSMEVAIQTLRAQKDAYDPELLQKFAEHFGASSNDGEVCQVPLRLVRPGMTMMQDVRTEVGTLLVPRGFEVSESFIQRMRNFGPIILGEKVTVLVRPESAQARANQG